MSTTTPTLVPRKRRGAELGLTVLAVLIGVGAYVAIGLGVEGTVPAGALTLAGALVATAVVGHLIVRRLAPYADPVLLPLVICLNGLGLAMIYRIDLGCEGFCLGGAYQPLANNQIIWTGLGVTLFCVVLAVVRDHRRLRIETEHWTMGVFSLDTWRHVLRETGFQVHEGSYSPGDDEYTMFACVKTR